MNAETGFRPVHDWTVGEAARAMSGMIAGRWEDAPFGDVSTDTRTLASGEFFLALSGENFDGHDYLSRALESGAAGLIIRRDCRRSFEDSVPVIRVDDTLDAYGALARHQRRCWGGKVIALSGSVGKTTTRRLLGRALSSACRVLEPARNHNNRVGVPLTLLGLRPEHDIAILELGMNQPGELAALGAIVEADAAGLTRIGRTHIGMFKSLDELVEAKLSIYTNLAHGSPAVVNVACPHSRRALTRYQGSRRLITFRGEGTQAASVRIENVRQLSGRVGYRFDLYLPDGDLRDLELAHFGRHYLEDVACACAMLIAAGYDARLITAALENFETEPLRGQMIDAGDWTFIMDCYNASPDSMRASLMSLREMCSMPEDDTRTVIVLADMLELGAQTREAHQALRPLLHPIGGWSVFGLGPEMKRLASEISAEGGQARGFADGDELIAALRAHLQPGDRVFFKGSHGFALERVAQAIAPAAEILSRKSTRKRAA